MHAVTTVAAHGDIHQARPGVGRRQRDDGLVVAVLAQPVFGVSHALVEHLAVDRATRLETETLQQAFGAGVAVDRGAPQRDLRARGDGQHRNHRSRPGLGYEARHDPHGGIPMRLVTGHERLGDLGQPCRGGSGAEPIDQLGPEHALLDPESALEADPDDPGDRHDVVAQPHTGAIGFRKDLDVGIAPQRHEMIDGLAHARDGEHLSRPRLDERQGGGIGDRHAVRLDPHARDAPAEQGSDVRSSGRRRQGQQQQWQHPPHQNVTRLRTSSA